MTSHFLSDYRQITDADYNSSTHRWALKQVSPVSPCKLEPDHCQVISP